MQILFRVLIIKLFFLQCSLFYSQNSGYFQKYIKNTDSLYNATYNNENFNKIEEQKLLNLLTNIYLKAKENGDQQSQLNALTTTIRVNSEMGIQTEVFDKITEALFLAQKEKDYYRWALLYCYVSRAFVIVGLYEKAKLALNNGLELSDNIKNKDQQHIVRSLLYGTKLGTFAISNPTVTKKENPRPAFQDSMLLYNNKALKEAQKVSLKNPERLRLLTERMRISGTLNIALENFKKGEQYLNEAKYLLSKQSDKRMLVSILRFIGILEENYGNYEKALNYYNDAIDINEKYSMDYEMYFLIATKNHVLDYIKGRSKEERELNSEQMRALKDSLELQQKKALNIAEKIVIVGTNEKKNNFKYVIITFLAVLVVLIFFLSFRKKSTKSDQKDITEIHEITSEIMDHLFDLIKKNDSTFYLEFSKAFKDYNNKLLELVPQLSQSDLEFCAFLKLNIHTKQIAIYKNLSVRSVETKKYRFRKKFNIPQETNIYTWFNAL